MLEKKAADKTPMKNEKKKTTKSNCQKKHFPDYRCARKGYTFNKQTNRVF